MKSIELGSSRGIEQSSFERQRITNVTFPRLRHLVVLLVTATWSSFLVIPTQSKEVENKTVSTISDNKNRNNNVYERNNENKTNNYRIKVQQDRRRKRQQKRCSICNRDEIMLKPDNDVVTLISAMFDITLSSKVKTCSDLEQHGQTGKLSMQQCQDFKQSQDLSKLCGCDIQNNNKTNENNKNKEYNEENDKNTDSDENEKEDRDDFDDHDDDGNKTKDEPTINHTVKYTNLTMPSWTPSDFITNTTHSSSFVDQISVIPVSVSSHVFIRLLTVAKRMDKRIIKIFTKEIKALLEDYWKRCGDADAIQDIQVRLLEQALIPLEEIEKTNSISPPVFLIGDDNRQRRKRRQHNGNQRYLDEFTDISNRSESQSNIQRNVSHYALDTLINVTGFITSDDEFHSTVLDYAPLINSNQAILIHNLQDSRFGHYFRFLNQIHNLGNETKKNVTHREIENVKNYNQSSSNEVPYRDENSIIGPTSCRVCDDYEEMTKGDMIITANTVNFLTTEIRCSNIGNLVLTEPQCTVLQESIVPSQCGCQAQYFCVPASGDILVNSTTTPNPTNAATSQYVDIPGKIQIILFSVKSLMPESVVIFYEQQLSALFTEIQKSYVNQNVTLPSNVSPNLGFNVTVNLVFQQRIHSSSEQSRSLAGQQHQGLRWKSFFAQSNMTEETTSGMKPDTMDYPLDTWIDLTGHVSVSDSSFFTTEIFQNQLVQILNENQKLFIDNLMKQPTSHDNVTAGEGNMMTTGEAQSSFHYFESVTHLEASILLEDKNATTTTTTTTTTVEATTEPVVTSTPPSPERASPQPTIATPNDERAPTSSVATEAPRDNDDGISMNALISIIAITLTTVLLLGSAFLCMNHKNRKYKHIFESKKANNKEVFSESSIAASPALMHQNVGEGTDDEPSRDPPATASRSILVAPDPPEMSSCAAKAKVFGTRVSLDLNIPDGGASTSNNLTKLDEIGSSHVALHSHSSETPQREHKLEMVVGNQDCYPTPSDEDVPRVRIMTNGNNNGLDDMLIDNQWSTVSADSAMDQDSRLVTSSEDQTVVRTNNTKNIEKNTAERVSYSDTSAGHNPGNIESQSCIIKDSENLPADQHSIMVPAGKLGMIIDSSDEGPVVHTISPNGPMFGLLRQGDLIVAINDVDIRAMTAVQVTEVMIRSSNGPRKFTVRSKS